MIRGYPARVSVAPGERLVLHVATDAKRFRVTMHRYVDGFETMHVGAWLPGARAEDGRPDQDWQWPAYAFDIPRDWPSGAYVAHLQEAARSAVPLGAWMDRAAALFVVRGSGRARIVYKLPFATYQAYNCSGGGCFYHRPSACASPPGAKLTWQRPGGGIGGTTWGALDHYDNDSPRQTFAHWDARFIRWLARCGEPVEFCADLDVHDNPDLLARHALLLSVGHDEYWTEAMRAGVQAHVARGGHVAFFGANLCWWRIHLVDDATAMVCHQGGPHGAHDHWWPASGVHAPEDALTGVSYRHGGGWWDGPRISEGFVVQHADHWVFAGTGLGNGDRFGAQACPPLVGYECDGAPLARVDAQGDRFVLAPDARQHGTPADFVPLAVGPLNEAWQELPHRAGCATRRGLHSATLGMHRAPGTVFTVGTTDWAQVLANGSDVAVERITRNVIARLAHAEGRVEGELLPARSA